MKAKIFLKIKKAARKSSILVSANEKRKDFRDFIGDLLGIIFCKLARNIKLRQEWQPLVSVLLTSYNRPQMIRRAIQSVLGQTYSNFELIILDDNSNEETRTVIESYLQKDLRIRRYYSEVKDEDRWKEARYAALFNIGLAMARGELIAYLTDDDGYLLSKLEKMVKFFREHPAVKIAYNQQNYLPQNKTRRAYGVLKKPGHVVDAISAMHYKSCVEELGNWETGKGKEDADRYIVGADDMFFNKLARKYAFYPVREVLDTRINHKDTISAKMAEKGK